MRDVLRKGVILFALLVAVGFYAFCASALVEMFLGRSSDVLSILLSAVVGIFAYVLFRFVLNKGLSVLDKKILSMNVSLVAGYFFNFFFASNWGSHFEMTPEIAGMVYFVVSGFLFYFVLQLVFFRGFSNVEKKLVLLCYLLSLGVALFCRFYRPYDFDLNPLSSIFNFIADPSSIIISLVNIGIAIPMYTVCRMNGIKMNFIRALVLFVIIEVLQFILHRGILDVGDIVMYSCGYLIGVACFRFLQNSKLAFIVADESR